VSTNKQMETAQLLARFKLQVKRSLGETVDLENLSRNPAYARQRLAEIEEAALDEELLVMVLRVRDVLLPVEIIAKPAMEPAPMAASVAAEPAPKETRNYLMGARSW
jgi:hypothetical protein